MFIINKIRPEYFFQHDLPTDMGIRNLIIGNDYSTVLYNALRIVEKNLGHINPVKEKPFICFYLKYRTAVLRNLLLLPWQSHSGFYSFHRPTSYFKSDFEIVWDTEGDLLEKTCLNKFRTISDVNHQVIRWWRLIENRFHPFDYFRIAQDIPLTNKDRKSTRLNSSHVAISYAVFCLKKKNRTRFV